MSYLNHFTLIGFMLETLWTEMSYLNPFTPTDLVLEVLWTIITLVRLKELDP